MSCFGFFKIFHELFTFSAITFDTPKVCTDPDSRKRFFLKNTISILKFHLVFNWKSKIKTKLTGNSPNLKQTIQLGLHPINCIAHRYGNFRIILRPKIAKKLKLCFSGNVILTLLKFGLTNSFCFTLSILRRVGCTISKIPVLDASNGLQLFIHMQITEDSMISNEIFETSSPMLIKISMLQSTLMKILFVSSFIYSYCDISTDCTVHFFLSPYRFSKPSLILGKL